MISCDNGDEKTNVAPAADAEANGNHNQPLSVAKYQSILKKYFGYDSFRGIQEDIINSIGSGHDTLGLMPTGGGKSICFQVPALAMAGVCIVITPLIALMKDQVQHLRKKGIRASAIYSGMTRREVIKVLENSIFGGVKILYVSPERLSSELFLNKLKRIPVSFITVDEAHCISQWGYDFRPAYLQIAEIRKHKPEAPILALTATATLEVVDDIVDKLSIPHTQSTDTQKPSFAVFRMSFERKNLSYVVRKADNKPTELLKILTAVPGSAIVYVRSRERTKIVADFLRENGIPAIHYHAGLKQDTRDIRQMDWQTDRVRVMVATNAFGMGIDKPDVRVVIHIDCPESPEAYFQEAGRAGRDGKKAYAVLLFNKGDRRKLLKSIKVTYPEKAYVRKVYGHLGSYFQVGVGSGSGHVFSFDIGEFCHYFHHSSIRLEAALHLLQQAGYIEYEPEPDNAARLRFLLDRQELDRLTNLSAEEDRMLTALMRTYGGLFADFVYISEVYLSKQLETTNQEVYRILKQLSMRHIVEYIPQRKTPYIAYRRSREESERLVIPAAVYELRLAEYEKRINAMIAYAENDYICRGFYLLHYFGEKQDADYRCGQCDVCLEENRTRKTKKQREASAKEQILAYLSDGKKHHIQELTRLPIPKDAYEEALLYLTREEIINLADYGTTVYYDKPQ